MSSPPQDKRSLMSRIRDLSKRIVSYQRKFDSGEYTTYGGAQALQQMKQERQELQGQLGPFELIARGVSCRDCKHFQDVPVRLCTRFHYHAPTDYLRTEGPCGPEAKLFESLCGPYGRMVADA